MAAVGKTGEMNVKTLLSQELAVNSCLHVGGPRERDQMPGVTCKPRCHSNN